MIDQDIALRALDASLGYGETVIADDVSLSIRRGEITTIIGANGSGKSTLLKAFARLLPVRSGRIELDGTPISAVSTRLVAQRLAMLPQRPITPNATTVRDLVARGRNPHAKLFQRETVHDAEIIDAALAATGIADLAHRDASSLSGGQLQRAWIALVLAQDTPVLLLDEPTTFLDLSHQVEVLRLVRDINRKRNTTVVMVLHDLTLAGRYSDRLVAIKHGSIVADGTPWEVLTPETLRAAFELEALVVPDPATGTPLVVPTEPQFEECS